MASREPRRSSWPVRAATFLSIVVIIGSVGIVWATWSFAVVPCSVTGTTLSIQPAGDETVRVTRDTGGAIHVNDSTCDGNPTVASIDFINLQGEVRGGVIIDLTNGGFEGIRWTIDVGSGGGQVLQIRTTDSTAINVTAGSAGIDLGSNNPVSVSGVERARGTNPEVDVTQIVGVDALELVGGPAADTLSAGGNSITGGPLTLPTEFEGGLGNDSIIGGSGMDTASYASASEAVTVSLDIGGATGGAGTDTLASIENVIGSPLDDSITGDANPNELSGGSGSDTLDGGDGDDRLFGGDGDDTLTGGPGSDSMDGGDQDSVGDTCFRDDADPEPTGCERPSPSPATGSTGPSPTGTTGPSPTGTTGSTTPSIELFVSGVHPSSGSIDGNTRVRIEGSGLGETNGVLFGSATGSIVSVADELVVVDSPPATTPGSVEITLLVGPERSPHPVGNFVYEPHRPPSQNRESGWAASVATPDQISFDPTALITNVVLATLLIAFIPFPATLFNNTFEKHYNEIKRWFRWWNVWSHRASRLVRSLLYGATILISATLFVLLDPDVVVDRSGIATWAGTVASLLFVTLVFGLAEILFRRSHDLRDGELRSYLWGIPVAILCVIVSRVAGIQPGYLYGAIAGFAFNAEMAAPEEGQSVAASSIWILVLTVIIWIARIPVRNAASGSHPGALMVALDVALAAIFVVGIEWLVFALLPIAEFPGKKLRDWSKWTWRMLSGLGLFGLLELLVDPGIGYPTRATPTTTIVLFLGFGAISVLFWGFFQIRDRHRPHATAK